MPIDPSITPTVNICGMGGGGGGGGGDGYAIGANPIIAGGAGGGASLEKCFCYQFPVDATSIEINVGAGGLGAEGSYDVAPPSGTVGETTVVSIADDEFLFYGGGGGGTGGSSEETGAYGGGAASSSGPGNSGTYNTAAAESVGTAGPYWPAINGVAGGLGDQPINAITYSNGQDGVVVGISKPGGSGGGSSRYLASGTSRRYAGDGGSAVGSGFVGGTAFYSGGGSSACGQGGGGGGSSRGNGGDGGTSTNCDAAYTECTQGGTGAGGGGGAGRYIASQVHKGRDGCNGGDGMVSIELLFTETCE